MTAVFLLISVFILLGFWLTRQAQPCPLPTDAIDSDGSQVEMLQLTQMANTVNRDLVRLPITQVIDPHVHLQGTIPHHKHGLLSHSDLHHIRGLFFINIDSEGVRRQHMEKLVASLGVTSPQNHRWFGCSPACGCVKRLQGLNHLKAHDAHLQLGPGGAACVASHASVLAHGIARNPMFTTKDWVLVLEDDCDVRQEVNRSTLLKKLDSIVEDLPSHISVLRLFNNDRRRTSCLPRHMDVPPSPEHRTLTKKHGWTFDPNVGLGGVALLYRKDYAQHLDSQGYVLQCDLQWDALLQMSLAQDGVSMTIYPHATRQVLDGLFYTGLFRGSIAKSGRRMKPGDPIIKH